MSFPIAYQQPPSPHESWDAFFGHFERCPREKPHDPVNEMVRAIVDGTVKRLLADMEKNKAPFWANKWRGQR